VHRDGGYAPQALLPARNAVPIPDTVDPVSATVIPDAVATPVHVCRSRARVEPGDRVAVIGAGGGVGIHMVQMARHCGAEVVGLERSEPKLGDLDALGVSPVLVGDAMPGPDGLFPAGRPTTIIDLAGSTTTLDWSLDALEPGGRMVVLTTFRDVAVDLDPRRLVLDEVAVIGSKYASRAEIAEAAALVAAGDIRPVVGAVSGPGEVLQLHDRLRAGTLLGRGALDWR
jgi:propanol-preferring alcohol dehydrogenase